jgi:hypothetical protein
VKTTTCPRPLRCARASALHPGAVRQGRVRGRYFRENFAQGGFDLVQVLPEVITNADAAIAAAQRATGRIELRFGTPAPEFVSNCKRELRRLGFGGAPTWQHELTCTDDGEGVDADVVDRRLGTLGIVPESSGSEGCSVGASATCGLRGAPGGSKGCATAGWWSPGSSPAPATSPTRSCTFVTSRPGAATSSAWGSREAGRE